MKRHLIPITLLVQAPDWVQTLIAVALSATGTLAANRKVNIVNKTGFVMTNFYASNVGANTWEEDMLDKMVLEDGETFEANIDDGTGACRFDFKAIFQDGQEMIRRGINVCQIGTFTYNK